MEFRYRAIDGDRPTPPTDTTSPSPSPNPTVSFLSARSMSGGGASEVHVHEAIQREIEKEQIRQEIIIAEAARKRELIAEVLQEMAIEREMAKRTGMSLEDKLSMWINQKKLSNQNLDNNNLFRQMYTGSNNSLVTSQIMQSPPEATGTSNSESNKEKLIVLDRADPIGEKRKAAEDIQAGVERAKRSKDDDKEGALKAKTMSSKASRKKGESKLRNSFKFWCEICKVGAFNETVMRNHELGKKHMAAVKQQNDASSTSVAPASVTAPESIVVAKETTGKETEGEKNDKETFWCKTCNVWTNSEKMMENHKLGKKHKALLEKQQGKPQAVLDTKLITVPVLSLDTDAEDKELVDTDAGDKELVPVISLDTDDGGDKESVDHTKGEVHCVNKS